MTKAFLLFPSGIQQNMGIALHFTLW